MAKYLEKKKKKQNKTKQKKNKTKTKQKQNKTNKKKTNKKQKTKKNKTKRSLKRLNLTCCPCLERERSEGTRHGIDIYGARRSAQSSSNEGQRAMVVSRGQREGGWVEK